MKTMCMWVRSGCRKPKFEQLATTPGAAGYIINTAQAAKAKRGKLYIVDAKTADHARTIINLYNKHLAPADPDLLPVVLSLCDHRIAKYGAVPDAMDNPLHQDNLHPYSMDDAFGKGLFT